MVDVRKVEGKCKWYLVKRDGMFIKTDERNKNLW